MESSQLAAHTQPRTAHRAPGTGICCIDSPTIQSAGGALGSVPARAERMRVALSLAPGPGRGEPQKLLKEGRQQLEQQPSLKIILTLVYYCH